MKKIFVIAFMMLISVNMFSQRVTTTEKQEYATRFADLTGNCTINTEINGHSFDIVSNDYAMVIENSKYAIPAINRVSSYVRTSNTEKSPAVLVIVKNAIEEDAQIQKLISLADRRKVKLYGMTTDFKLRELN